MKSGVSKFLLGKYAVRRAKKVSPANPNQPTQPNAQTQDPQEGNIAPKDENKDLAKLKNMVTESQNILAEAKAVFPFNFFPDKVTIDHHKLTIIYNKFFGISQTVSVPIENIKNVQADCGPFFGSLTITSDHFVNNTQEVHYLWKDDAKKIQRLIQGAMVAATEGIDLTKIDSDELTKQLDDLGKGDSADKEPPKDNS